MRMLLDFPISHSSPDPGRRGRGKDLRDSITRRVDLPEAEVLSSWHHCAIALMLERA